MSSKLIRNEKRRRDHRETGELHPEARESPNIEAKANYHRCGGDVLDQVASASASLKRLCVASNLRDAHLRVLLVLLPARLDVFFTHGQSRGCEIVVPVTP